MKKFFIGIAVALACVICVAAFCNSEQVEAKVFTDQEVAEWYFEEKTPYPIEVEYEVEVGNTYLGLDGVNHTNIYAWNGDELVGMSTISMDHYRSMMD